MKVALLVGIIFMMVVWKHKREVEMKLWIEKELFQWETERYVNIILDDTDPLVTFIQFYNNVKKAGPEVPLKDNKAKIPDYLLEESLPIMAVACMGIKGRTQVVGRREFKVIKRAKPEEFKDDIKHVIYDGGEEV